MTPLLRWGLAPPEPPEPPDPPDPPDLGSRRCMNVWSDQHSNADVDVDALQGHAYGYLPVEGGVLGELKNTLNHQRTGNFVVTSKILRRPRMPRTWGQTLPQRLRPSQLQLPFKVKFIFKTQIPFQFKNLVQISFQKFQNQLLFTIKFQNQIQIIFQYNLRFQSSIQFPFKVQFKVKFPFQVQLQIPLNQLIIKFQFRKQSSFQNIFQIQF